MKSQSFEKCTKNVSFLDVCEYKVSQVLFEDEVNFRRENAKIHIRQFSPILKHYKNKCKTTFYPNPHKTFNAPLSRLLS